jgi:hypothetical protein
VDAVEEWVAVVVAGGKGRWNLDPVAAEEDGAVKVDRKSCARRREVHWEGIIAENASGDDIGVKTKLTPPIHS